MNQLEKELQRIKDKVNEMWDLVEYQVFSGKDALLNADKELASRVIKKEKKVNTYDVKIDRMCENFFALYNPVAVDLRWVLAVLKINANLEGIGDSAKGIARLIKETGGKFDPALLETLQVFTMYDVATAMLQDVRKALDEEDTELAQDVIERDKLLNKIHQQTDKLIVEYIKTHPDNLAQSLKVSNIIRRLERIGDQITNIAEEIIFYVDVKVVKHTRDKKNEDE